MSVEYGLKGPITNAELNALFSTGWPSWQTAPDTSDWQPILDHCLTYVTAHDGDRLIGFVQVAWDGRVHAFILDTRVDPEYRHQGIGVKLVELAAQASRDAGCEVLHVDYTADLTPFYEACGFKSTAAGLIWL